MKKEYFKPTIQTDWVIEDVIRTSGGFDGDEFEF